jgi:hypothetical protein
LTTSTQSWPSQCGATPAAWSIPAGIRHAAPDDIKTTSNAIRAAAEAAQSPRDLTETEHHTNAARLEVPAHPAQHGAARSRVLQVATGAAAAFRKNRAR